MSLFLSPQSHEIPLAHSPRFGQTSAGISALPPWMQKVDPAFDWIQATRGRELLVIDIAGFTLLRTLVDLSREFIFKKTQDGKRELNWASARERLMMELLGTSPDFAVGLTGFGIGALVDRALQKGKGPKAFSNKFTTVESLETFKNILDKPQIESSHDFIHALAKLVETPAKGHLVESLLHQGVRSAIDDPQKAEAVAEDLAEQLAKHLGQKTFDVKLHGEHIGFNKLILEASHLVEALEKQATKARWRIEAQQLLRQTMKSNWIRIPIGAVVGLAINLTAPHLIHMLTRKLDGINDYPGVKGLRDLEMEDHNTATAKPDGTPGNKRHGFAPYVTQNLKKGKIGPLLAALVPLPLALGMVDTERLISSPRAAINLPGKGFFNRFAKFMQYSGRFPYVGGQQIAILYGIVLGARVGLSRNAIEWRERCVDGLLGWTTWILATPFIKKAIGGFFDDHMGTQMTKYVNGSRVLKSRAEITRLLAHDPKLLSKTLKGFLPLEWGSIIATIGLLGLVEPLLSVKWTEWQQHRLENKEKNTVKAPPTIAPNTNVAFPAVGTLPPAPHVVAPMTVPPPVIGPQSAAQPPWNPRPLPITTAPNSVQAWPSTAYRTSFTTNLTLGNPALQQHAHSLNPIFYAPTPGPSTNSVMAKERAVQNYSAIQQA
jgi:hypothetical protein